MYKLLLSTLALFGCASIIQGATITETAAASSDFTSLSAALELTDLDDVLDCDWFFCRYTVFAPTDTAFDALGDLKDKLLTEDWVAHLRRILLYHVAPGVYASDEIPSDGSIYTLGFEKVNTTVTDSGVTINSANVVAPDVEASNGIIHGIDSVLIPSFMTKDIVATAREAGNFETLLAAVDAAGLTETLQGDGPFTLFAPTDSAFNKLGQGAIDALLEDTDTLADILKYHVSSGIVLADELEDGMALPTLLADATIDVSLYGIWFFKFLYLNENVRISFSDILTSNGVIHVIDSVLVPDSVDPPEPTIAEALEADPTLTTLTTALKAADLFDTLSGEGPFTVFAPSDDAFAELGDEVIAGLLASPSDLAPILTYHVVGAEVFREDLESGAVETLNGASVIAHAGVFRSYINEARITYFDIKASNGVVHIINEVLLPPAGNCLEVAEANGLTEFVSAVEAANLESALTDQTQRFSIFAPTNSAFAALSSTPDQATLANILSYHVVPAVAAASDLSDGDMLPTLVEDTVIDVSFKYIFFFVFVGAFLNDEAEIVSTDLLCSNGIIHQIDKILTVP